VAIIDHGLAAEIRGAGRKLADFVIRASLDEPKQLWHARETRVTTLSSTGIASAPSESPKPHLDHPMGIRTILVFLAIMALGLFFAAYNIYRDISTSGTVVTSILPFLLLGVALLIALGFEFVNGFHDTANAVATVIYTHSLAPPVAVVWSGFFNFFGVLVSSGAVAFGIVSLLPVELILQVGSKAGFAMVFAMLIAAIIWNLGTWWLGSRHLVRIL
jgi:PiT family inorganic phosphate transporter